MSVSQYGTDGFGHQLFGMMSLIACSDISYVSFPHNGKFEHLSKEESIMCKDFINNFLINIFGDFENISKKKVIMPRRKNNLCLKSFEFQKDIIHVFDNCWSTDNIGKYIKKFEFDKYISNSLNDLLTINRSFVTNHCNVVIHIRGGDGNNRTSGSLRNGYLITVNNIIKKMSSQHKNITFHIHSNSQINTMFKSENIICKCNSDIMQSFSEMIFADVLIAGDSSLSLVAPYFNKNKLVIVPNETTCFSGNDRNAHPIHYYNNCVTFNDFINCNMSINDYL
tara:strand:- start:3795 stop:4637 length:843 start_codon:yes stop_codon:yes gene_type:complete